MKDLFEIDGAATHYFLDNEIVLVKFLFNCVVKRFYNRVTVQRRLWKAETEFDVCQRDYYMHVLREEYRNAEAACLAIFRIMETASVSEVFAAATKSLDDGYDVAGQSLFGHYEDLRENE